MAGQGWKKFNAGEVLRAVDFMEYAVDQSVQVYADSTARGTALGTAVSEGMMSYLADSDTVQVYDGTDWLEIQGSVAQIDDIGDVTLTSLADGEILVYDSASSLWVNGTLPEVNGYTYMQEVEFTTSGTFTKASYPDAKIFKVMVLGAGGGGGGVNANGDTGGGGGGGGYAERWVLVADMDASVTVTIGAGGPGRNGNVAKADAGGASYFGSGSAYEVSANGGDGGYRWSSSYGEGGIGGTGIAGTRLIRGLPGFDGPALMGAGAGNTLYPSYIYTPTIANRAGLTGENPGQGGSGGQRSSSGNNAGGTGADGYCRIEVYG